VVNRWTAGIVLSVAIVLWSRRLMRGHSGGAYNFAPLIGGTIACVSLVILWLAIIISALIP
jgi:hypothetical protein